MIRTLFALLAMLALLANAGPAWSGAPRDYPLGAGDAIRVTVFQQPDLTLETRVAESGRITFPLIGEVLVAGLSTAAAEQRIAELLQRGNFVKRPQVSVVVTEVRSRQVAVVGRVNKPGRFPLESASLRLTDALTLAGGIAPDGADIAIVTGQRDGKPFRQEADIAAIYLRGDSAGNILMLPGDEIYVPRAPVFYIYGEAQKPGSYRVERNMTVMQALAQGGGLTQRGTQRNLKLIRRGADGSKVELSPKLSDPIQPDDVLYVRESLF